MVLKFVNESILMTGLLLVVALLGIAITLWSIQLTASFSRAFLSPTVDKALKAAASGMKAGILLLLLSLILVLMKLCGQEMLEYHARVVGADRAWLTMLLIVLVVMVVVATGLSCARRTQRWALLVLALNGLIVLSGGGAWAVELAQVNDVVEQEKQQLRKRWGSDHQYEEEYWRQEYRKERHLIFILPMLALAPGLFCGVLASSWYRPPAP